MQYVLLNDALFVKIINNQLFHLVDDISLPEINGHAHLTRRSACAPIYS